MPQLPSGLKLALDVNHIMPPDRNWFRAPEGHFWYWTPAEGNAPPFAPDQVWEQQAATAPVPTCREAMERYVRVCFYTEDWKLWWRGEMLSEFPRYGMLSDEDTRAWLEWLDSDRVREFLDRAIVKCETQAEVNKEASGWAHIRSAGRTADGRVKGYKPVDDPTRKPH